MFIRLYTYISSYMCGNTELFSKTLIPQDDYK